MKKVRIMLLALIGLTMIMPLSSCKKGADDPMISLKSRESRLAGEWDVTSYVSVSTSGTTTTTNTYDDGSLTYVSGSTTQTGSYTWTWTIDKKGTYNFKRTTTWSGSSDTYEEEGYWYFISGNKDNDVKNKECVCFQSTKRTYTSSGGTNVYTEEGGDMMCFRLTELKSKEIKGEFDYSYSGSSTNTNNITFVLTAK